MSCQVFFQDSVLQALQTLQIAIDSQLLLHMNFIVY